ncbi:MAG TPA: hypothetical protein VKZ63_03715 [Kofleriaceae bacterium]|nr:hypothetical protein [Kofleriaceae bacterium]
MYDRFDDLARSPFDGMDTLDPTEELVLADSGDLDDLPTEETMRSPIGGRLMYGAGEAEILSSTLPVNARDAFDAFCDVESSPRWVTVVKSVRVLSWNAAGRPKRAAYLARLQNGSIGYTLHYRYNERERSVSWGTAPGSLTLVAGRAQFLPLGDRATLMQYQLTLELPEDALPPWEDPFFSGHATSVVMNDFRDYVTRLHRP